MPTALAAADPDGVAGEALVAGLVLLAPLSRLALRPRAREVRGPLLESGMGGACGERAGVAGDAGDAPFGVGYAKGTSRPGSAPLPGVDTLPGMQTRKQR